MLMLLTSGYCVMRLEKSYIRKSEVMPSCAAESLQFFTERCDIWVERTFNHYKIETIKGVNFRVFFQYFLNITLVIIEISMGSVSCSLVLCGFLYANTSIKILIITDFRGIFVYYFFSLR